MIKNLSEEYFRLLRLNPRLLKESVPLKDQLIQAIRDNQRQTGGAPVGSNEVGAENFGDPSGGGANMSDIPGLVPNSPLQAA